MRCRVVNKEFMRACVFGAGAVGGYLAAKLATGSDWDVSVVARGAHLQAIRERGLRLVAPEGTVTGRFQHATDQTDDLPEQDIVFVTLKSYALPGVAANLRRLIGERGCAVFIGNGMPWWWNFGDGEVQHGRSCVDSQGQLWRDLGPQHALGGVVYSLNEVVEPGVVLHRGNNRWILGEPGNGTSSRLARAVDLLQGAGLNAEASTDLRLCIWRKLLRNVCMNPLCALTRLDVESAILLPHLVETGRDLAADVVDIARAKGCDLSPYVDEDTRVLTQGAAIQGKAAQGTRPSMLQDVLAGKPMEIDALLGQLHQFALDAKVPTRALAAIHALAQGLNESLLAGVAKE
jgi:2-dehydropantoate 2-reductase